MLAPRRCPIGTCATCPSCSGPATSSSATTRKIPAQLNARRGDARIGITLDRPEEDGSWIALARNARRLRAGDDVIFDAGLRATVQARAEDGRSIAVQPGRRRFRRCIAGSGRARAAALYRPAARTRARRRAGLSGYVRRHEGAVAAPTAGLHFTPALLGALETAGIRLVTVTLHVGAGTFLPVREDDISRHHLHPERGVISSDAAASINNRTGRVVAIGTTSLRLLKSAADESGRLAAFSGETDLFIRPGYRFKLADVLLTNFHLPRSTLFMLVCAFAGTRAHARCLSARNRQQLPGSTPMATHA